MKNQEKVQTLSSALSPADNVMQIIAKSAVMVIALGWVAFQLVSAYMLGFHEMIQQPLHVGFAIALAMLCYSFSGDQRKGKPIPVLDLILALIGIGGAIYLVSQFGRLELRVAFVDDVFLLDKIFCFTTVILILEACRRTLGWALTIIAIVAISYGFIGQFLGGALHHSGLNLTQFTDLQFLTTYGIYGLPTEVSADMIFYFVLVGTILQKSGGGDLFINVAYFLTGRSKGGSAKASVISSALFGTVSGSAVANVLVTGLLTIPLMKKTGYPPYMAGAVEAAASTGGQLAPPIMGAAAFLLAQIVGVNYSEVVLASIVPAILFYGSLYLFVDFYSRRQALHTITDEERSKLVSGLTSRLHLFLPLIYLIYLLFEGYSLMTVGFRTIIAIILASFFNKKSRMSLSSIVEALKQGAEAAVNVAIPCAVAGILVGMIVNTGLVPKFKDILISVTGGSFVPTLIVAMLLSLILGVGMPTAPAYILSAILIAPTLVDMGVPVLTAHLFVFYFAVISMVTPPVALAGFAAAGVAESDIWKTGVTAFKISLVAFLVPYAFVFQPGLLLHDTWGEIAWSFFFTSTGIAALALVLTDYCFGHIKPVIRTFLFIASILLITPGKVGDVLGLFLTIICVSISFYLARHPSKTIKALKA